MFATIAISVIILGFVVAAVAFGWAHMSAVEARKATQGMLAAERYTAMRASWEAAAKRAQLEDAGIKAVEVRLGKRSPTGTVIGYRVVSK